MIDSLEHQAQIEFDLFFDRHFCARGIHPLKMNAATVVGRSQISHITVAKPSQAVSPT
jgi:hypothetical protein